MANALIMWPIRFTATSYVLRATVNGVTENLPFPATGSLTLGRNYWPSGDGQADSDGGVGGVGDLLALLNACLNGHSEPQTLTTTLTASFRVQVDISANTFQLLWAHANTTLDEAIFGFANASSPALGAAATTSGGLLPKGIFRPRRPISKDTRERQPIVAANARAVSNLQRSSRLTTSVLKERDIGFMMVLKQYVLEEYAGVTEPYGAFETAWLQSLSYGRAFRVYPDETNLGTSAYSLYKMRDLADPLDRNESFPIYWDFELPMVRVA